MPHTSIQDGDSALIHAVRGGHTDCVRLLVEAGADKETKDSVRDVAFSHPEQNFPFILNSIAFMLFFFETYFETIIWTFVHSFLFSYKSLEEFFPVFSLLLRVATLIYCAFNLLLSPFRHTCTVAGMYMRNTARIHCFDSSRSEWSN